MVKKCKTLQKFCKDLAFCKDFVRGSSLRAMRATDIPLQTLHFFLMFYIYLKNKKYRNKVVFCFVM